MSLAENLGPVTKSLSYWMGVATHSTGWCVYSDLPPGPAPSGHVAVCVRLRVCEPVGGMLGHEEGYYLSKN